MVLHPLEFTDCLLDSPHFRENLLAHEKELDRTSQAIKVLIREVEELFAAAKNLSKAQRSFSDQLKKFKFDCIGTTQTEDEQCISESLEKMGNLIADIEDERDRMLEKANDQFIQPLINFRKKDIGDAKEGKRKFDRQTTKFCTQLEKYCSLTTKKNDATLQEADAVLDMERRAFYSASMDYVLMLQKVQEKKKFEFVETLLRFMYAWLTFYHQGHEVAQDFKPYMFDLQHRLQLTRDNFNINFESAEKLRNKMLEVRNSSGNNAKSTLNLNSSKPEDFLLPDGNRSCTKQGYVFLMDKKPWGTTWTKYYCLYQKENRVMTMIPYLQGQTRGITTETFVVTNCTRRQSDSIEKRWCFDVTAQDKPSPLTFQALGKDDRQQWLDSLDGKEPIYASPSPATPLALNHSGVTQVESPYVLNDKGVQFVETVIEGIESRGLDEQQGLYRLVGVGSKVNRLLQMWFSSGCEDLSPTGEWDVKSLTSGLKKFFGNLPEPLLTFKLHSQFIEAVKSSEKAKSIKAEALKALVLTLPDVNQVVLRILTDHLSRVASFADTNLMTIANLGVCFGPTLMRSEEETMAAIMEIKFCNVVVELLIEYHNEIFDQDGEHPPSTPRTYESTPQYANNSPHLYQYDYQNHRGASSPLDPGLGTPTRRDVAKRPAPAPPRGPVALYMSGVNRTPPSPPPGSTSFVGLGLSHSNSSDRSSPLDDSNHFGDGGGNSSDYDNAPTSSKVMSSSFGGGVGVGGSGGLGPSSKGGGAPRTIWDAHFTSRSEGANIHNAASSSSGTERSGHYYSTVPLKDAGREASSPAHTSSSESLDLPLFSLTQGGGSSSGHLGGQSSSMTTSTVSEPPSGFAVRRNPGPSRGKAGTSDPDGDSIGGGSGIGRVSVQLKNSRVSVAALTTVGESNIQNPGGGGGVSGNGVGGGGGVGVSGNGIGGGGGGGSTGGGSKNLVANTAAMFENNSVENNSPGSPSQPPWHLNPAKNLRMGAKTSGGAGVNTGGAGVNTGGAGVNTGGAGVNDAVDGTASDPNARVRDFFPAASTKRKASGTAVSLTPSNPPPISNNNNNGVGVVNAPSPSGGGAGSAAPAGRGRRVRTIYACAADHGSELSFEANQILVNVKKSQEPGWLEGTLNGKVGLIPANYVEFLPDAAT